MLRTGASRTILRSINTTSTSALKATSSPLRQQLRSQLCTISRRPHAATIAKPLAPKTLNLVRVASSRSREPVDQIDHKREEEIQKKKLQATPESVSTDSTIMPMTGTPGDENKTEDEGHVASGIKHDFVRYPKRIDQAL